MAQVSQHAAIIATTANSAPMLFNIQRQFLYVRNYAIIPATPSIVQTITFYLRFGAAATVGTAGEIEVPPGVDFVFGGNFMKPNLAGYTAIVFPNCPTETVNVITQTGTALGCLWAINIV